MNMAVQKAYMELQQIYAEMEVLRVKGKALNDFVKGAKDAEASKAGESDIPPQPEQDG